MDPLVIVLRFTDRVSRRRVGRDGGRPRPVSRQLFRFGLERPASEAVVEFLGGPVTPAALLADMQRMKS